jgi:leader peptidase (prepilin peptidase)/N-methyltransferase
MGHGDFKLLAALGAWLGWQALPIVILISSFVGAIVGISLILLKKNQLGQAIPYGPYLALAGWMTLLYADNIQQSYFNWLGL